MNTTRRSIQNNICACKIMKTITTCRVSESSIKMYIHTYLFIWKERKKERNVDGELMRESSIQTVKW